MFNKRDACPKPAEETRPPERPIKESPRMSDQQRGAVIGPSIQIDGTLKGDEDLLIQGKVKGTIELKKNSVTVGESGEVKADIFAHTIVLEGQVEGKLVGSERVVIRKTAQIRGTLVAPRVTLEDGAKFNGTIDMDPESDAVKSGFSGQSQTGASSSISKPDSSSDSTPSLSSSS